MPFIPFHFFLLLIIGLTLASQFVVYRIVAKYLVGIGVNAKFTRRYLPFIFVLINLPFLFIHFTPQIFYQGLARKLIMMPFYAYQTLSIAILFVALITFFVKFILKTFRIQKKAKKNLKTQELPSESRRSFLKKTAIGIGGYTFIGSMYSIYNRDDYKIEDVSLRLKDLPPQLRGLRIVMISDIHAGLYMTEDDMSKYTKEINKLKPDLIFIPGDFVTSKTNEIIPFVKSFSGLKSKFGNYACLGNHDFFANPNTITEKLEENQITVLRNATTELDINGSKLMLSGVDDGSRADFTKVAYEANSLNTTRILLCHKPYYFDNAIAGGYDVMLSGHTHGGQIVFANLLGVKLTPAALFSPYVAGKYHRGDSILYVSRGVGTVGLPVRVNCPPEITVFTLIKKS